MINPIFNRILIKLSGEGMGNNDTPLATDTMNRLALEIKKVYDLGVEVCLVIGGGNFWRGAKGVSKGISRITGDYIGMLATMMNALAFAEVLNKIGIDTRIMTSLTVEGVGEVFNQAKAERHLQKRRIVIFAGGTGSPFFTTDTCSVLRASEMKCDAFFKATQVDGIYDSDPRSNPNAVRYDKIDYQTALDKRLGVMDLTAMAMAQNANLPVVVFNAHTSTFADIVCGKGQFSIMKG